MAQAFETLDKNLAILLDAAGGEHDIIVFSDHSQFNVHTVLTPNDILVSEGLLSNGGDGYVIGNSGCFIECCGGTAFFHTGTLSAADIKRIRALIEGGEGFRRFISDGEMRESGYTDAAFGFCAQMGYAYGAFASGEKANHGYPLDMPGSQVFYMIRGDGHVPGSVTRGGSLLEIAPMIARRLGLNLDIRQL